LNKRYDSKKEKRQRERERERGRGHRCGDDREGLEDEFYSDSDNVFSNAFSCRMNPVFG
jgi:hypothetical protein